jgi:UDP-3-O-[3-hydroxymyristoyl] glucosamine N-acyltransferase
MEFTAQQIADTLGGSVEGNPEIAVSKFIKIDEDEQGGRSFLANPLFGY